MAVATSTALLIGAGVSAVGAGVGAHQAIEAERGQRHSRYRTRAAQDEALRVQMIERARTARTELDANRPTPASTVQLTDEMLAQTDRTGGVDDRLRLARPSKLGGG